MVSPLFYDPLVLLAPVWLFVMLPGAESRRGAPIPPTATPIKPQSTRPNEPKPLNGLTQPHCALCARDTTHSKAPPPVPPDPMVPTTRRPREVAPSIKEGVSNGSATCHGRGRRSCRACAPDGCRCGPCTCTLRINTTGSPGRPSQGQKGLDERALMAS